MSSKLALGIHHFNVAYNLGDEAAYHRQVREGIAPFVDLIFQHSEWNVSIEMAGLSIEFIALNYPSLLDRFRNLISRGQIELISCSYAPQIWTVFPGGDLIKSINLNDYLLQKFRLNRSRIFFMQENFIGPGVKLLSKWFDTIIVKDDYYNFLYEEMNPAPYFLYEKMKLLVAESHILEEVIREMNSNPRYHHLFNRVSTSLNLVDFTSDKKTSREHRKGPLTWRWYHAGSSERFSKAVNRPEHISSCIFDNEWASLVTTVLHKITNQGFTLSSIGEFIEKAGALEETVEAKNASLLLEGSWNMKKSEAGFIWMGKNVNRQEDDLLVRNHNWKSRSRLLALESMVKCLYPKDEIPPEIIRNIKQGWQYQFLAETSDATGWNPNKCEIKYSIQQSEKVLNLVERLVQAMKEKFSFGRIAINTKLNRIKEFKQQSYSKIRPKKIDNRQLFINPPEVYGMNHTTEFYKISDQTQLITVDFFPTNDDCGIMFRFSGEYLRYGSSLLENEITNVELAAIKSEYLCLPLPNGLIALEDDVYLVKHNEYVNIGCFVDKRMMRFLVKIKNPVKRPYHWKFSLFKGSQNEAIAYASDLNVFPTVII